MLEIAVEVDPARSVFVQETVAVRVHALGVERVCAGLALGFVRTLHQARIVRVDHEVARRVGDPHERDHAVAVQVFTGIFIEAAVIVVVVRKSVSASVVFYGGEHRFGAVGVEPRNHVDHLVTQHRRRARVVEQEADRLERKLAAQDMITLQVAHHEHRRALVRGDSRAITHLDEPDLPAFVRRADRPHVRVGTAVHERPQFIGESVVVEVGTRLGMESPAGQ